MTTGRVLRLSLLGMAVCVLAFLVFAGPIILGQPEPFDQWKRPYSVADVDIYLAWLDADPTRWSAMRAYRAIDMVFPAVVFVFVVSAARLTWTAGRVRQIVLACAVAYLLADYFENITLSGILNENGAAFSATHVTRAAMLTMIKWASLVIAAIPLIFRGGPLAMRYLRARFA